MGSMDKVVTAYKVNTHKVWGYNVGAGYGGVGTGYGDVGAGYGGVRAGPALLGMVVWVLGTGYGDVGTGYGGVGAGYWVW